MLSSAQLGCWEAGKACHKSVVFFACNAHYWPLLLGVTGPIFSNTAVLLSFTAVDVMYCCMTMHDNKVWPKPYIVQPEGYQCYAPCRIADSLELARNIVNRDRVWQVFLAEHTFSSLCRGCLSFDSRYCFCPRAAVLA